MWLLNARTYELQTFEGSNTPKYAILSHRWEDGEVSFKDMQKGRYHRMKGFDKIQACCRQALKDGLNYAWVDTCCIDKRSSAELSEAINSMYAWYGKAAICYAYLSDFPAPLPTANVNLPKDDFTTSVWFTRGWTLQELLAPSELIFYDRVWNPIGSRSRLASEIYKRTNIPSKALVQFDPTDYSIAARMSWAAGRVTTRIEDRAYSLLGIFDVNMPLLYGEGVKAFRRLQENIMANSNDLSIFAWSHSPDAEFSMVAASPDSFGKSLTHSQGPMRTDFSAKLHETTSFYPYEAKYTASKHGIEGKLYTFPYIFNIHLVPLGCFLEETISWSESQGLTLVCMFMEYNSPTSVYSRVTVDNHSCILVRFDPDTGQPGKRHCEIIKHPIQHTASDKFNRSQLERFRLEVGISTWRGCDPVFIAAGTLHSDCSYTPDSPFERIRFSVPTAAVANGAKPCICVWYNTGDITPTPSVVIYAELSLDRQPVLAFAEPLSQKNDHAPGHRCDYKDSKGHLWCTAGCVTIRTQRISSSKRELQIFRAQSKSKLQTAFQGSSRDPYEDLKASKVIDVAGIGEVSMYEQAQKTFLLFRFSSYVPGIEMLPHEWATYPAMARPDDQTVTKPLYDYFYDEELVSNSRYRVG